jgi:hypothetical protein
MTSILRIALVAGALATLAPTTAMAADPPHIHATRTFAVTVDGVQTTRSGFTHTSSGRCDPGATSKGYERIVFHSTKAKIIQATNFDPLVLFGHGKPGDHILSTTARVTRHSTYTHDPLDPTCQGTGGGGHAPPPDCGTQRVHLPLDMDWYNPKGLVLRTPDLFVPSTPFFNCPVDGLVFPYILSTSNHSRTIIARIPAADLFNRAWKKHILLGSGRFASWSDGGGYTTSIHWALTLRAVHPR